MSKLIEPPSFISETKSFETYKKDLERWALLTTLEPAKQALMVVHLLDGDPSGIKEKIVEDLKVCLDRQKVALPKDCRDIAVTYYQLGVAQGFDKKYDEAIASLEAAVTVLGSTLASLKGKPGKMAIMETMELLPDIKAKIADVAEMKTGKVEDVSQEGGDCPVKGKLAAAIPTKRKIDEGVPDADLKSTSGISKLLEFFKSIYEKDSLSDGFKKYMAFERFRRSQGKSIQEFIPEWTTAYKKAKNIGCVLPDKVLAFKLLDAANLSQLERNLVLTGVDYTDAKILEQMQTALKKFIGRTAIGQNEDQRNVDSTYLTADNFETVLLSKGWTKPRGGGRGGGRGRGGKREREEPPEPSQEKRRKNYLGRDGKISKCFKCTCKHETDCDCECTFHLAHRCPGTGTREKADLGLFMQSNVETFFVTDDGKDDEFVLYIQTFAATPEIDIPPAAPDVGDIPVSASTGGSIPASTLTVGSVQKTGGNLCILLKGFNFPNRRKF